MRLQSANLWKRTVAFVSGERSVCGSAGSAGSIACASCETLFFHHSAFGSARHCVFAVAPSAPRDNIFRHSAFGSARHCFFAAAPSAPRDIVFCRGAFGVTRLYETLLFRRGALGAARHCFFATAHSAAPDTCFFAAAPSAPRICVRWQSSCPHWSTKQSPAHVKQLPALVGGAVACTRWRSSCSHSLVEQMSRYPRTLMEQLPAHVGGMVGNIGCVCCAFIGLRHLTSACSRVSGNVLLLVGAVAPCLFHMRTLLYYTILYTCTLPIPLFHVHVHFLHSYPIPPPLVISTPTPL